MTKPYLAALSGKQKEVIKNFKGLNTELAAFSIDDGEAADMKNIRAKGPEISVRQPREVFLSLDSIADEFSPKAFGTVMLKDENTELFTEYLSFVSNNYWYYYDPNEGFIKISKGMHYFSGKGLSDMAFFVDRTVIVGSSIHKAYYFDVEGNTGVVTANLDTDRQIPWASFIVSHANRLYVARKGHNYLYAGGLRKPELWQSVTDGASFEFETPDKEGCSGIASFADRLIFFKPHHMYEIFGTDPLIGYQSSKVGKSIGCTSYQSIKEVCSHLIWLGDGAVYMYGGGANPKNIGKPIQKYLDNLDSSRNACAGVSGHLYYLSLPQREGSVLLVYNFDTGFWYCEDDFEVSFFCNFEGELYALSKNTIYKMFSEADEEIEWFWLSKCFSSNVPSIKQDTERLYLCVQKPESTEISVKVFSNTGQEGEASLSVFSESGTDAENEKVKIYRIEVPVSISYNADWLQFKISGKGKCKIHSLERLIRKRKGSW